MKLKIGLDIGGTKCAISTGECEGGAIKILSREEFATAGLSWRQVLEEFARRIDQFSTHNSQLLTLLVSAAGGLSIRGVASPCRRPIFWDGTMCRW